MRILAEDTLALVVDFQERLVPVIDNNEGLIHNTEILIKGLQILEVPTLVTQQYTKGIGMTVPELSSLYGSDFEYYDKITFSCAMEEGILQTVIDLIEAGYQVILVEDCVGSRRESDRLTGIKRAIVEGAIPTTYEAILFELTKIAGTDKFKQISKLIK